MGMQRQIWGGSGSVAQCLEVTRTKTHSENIDTPKETETLLSSLVSRLAICIETAVLAEYEAMRSPQVRNCQCHLKESESPRPSPLLSNWNLRQAVSLRSASFLPVWAMDGISGFTNLMMPTHAS
jgi:hypothetical protein